MLPRGLLRSSGHAVVGFVDFSNFHDGAYSGGRNSSCAATFQLPIAACCPPWSALTLPYTAFSLKCWLDTKEAKIPP